MSATIGDGMETLAVAAAIVTYLYVRHEGRQKKLEVIHQERMAAMEKGIPLPEFPLEPPPHPPNPMVLPILGTVLLTLSVGTMIVLFRTLDIGERSFWITPLPFAFMGAGLLAFHYLKGNSWR